MERRIRVAHVITNFALGGALESTLAEIRELDQNRFEVFLGGRMEGELVSTVKSLPGIQFFDVPSLCREVSPLKDTKAVFEVRRFCRAYAIDILHTHSSKPGVVARLGGRLAGVPGIVHTHHGLSFNEFMPWWKRQLIVHLERALSRITDALLLVSASDRNTADRLRIGAARFVQTIYNGISYAPFERPPDRSEVRRSFGFSEGESVIGFCGRFTAQKGLHVLVDAFAEIVRDHPRTRLMLVGDGELRDELNARIRRLRIENKITITGFRRDIPRMLAAMDLFVMTSLWEGLSRSLVEAFYAGLPVIATDVGGTSDAVREGETGWLIPPGDVPATAKAMRSALSRPESAKSLAQAGHRWARSTFDPKARNARISELYERLVT